MSSEHASRSIPICSRPTARQRNSFSRSACSNFGHPGRLREFKKVSAIVRRYLTKDDQENLRLKERFNNLTGRRDPATKKSISAIAPESSILKYRLSDILPEAESRKQLFEELDGYIRAVIRHMIIHSPLDWDSYKVVRDGMGVAGTPWRESGFGFDD